MGFSLTDVENVQPSRWAERFANGDRSVGDQLGGHIQSVLRKRFLSLGLSGQDAEDLVQDCTALVFNSMSEFDPQKGTLDAWLSGYARNVARSWWRGSVARNETALELDGVLERPVPARADLPGAGVMEAAITSLSPIDQELLQMRFGFGYSFDEIAAMAGLSTVNARKRVSRAVESLRRNPQLRVALGFVD